MAGSCFTLLPVVAGGLRVSPAPISGRAIVSDAKLPRVLPRDVPDYHARQAAHLRALAENAATPRLKDRLLNEAERHEGLEAAEDVVGAID
jgi:hypothetical protein